MKHKKLVIALAVGVGGGAWMCSAWAAGNVDTRSGEVSVVNRDGQPRGISKGDRIVEGETIVTGRDGELLLTTDDSGVLAVRPRSRLLIEAYRVNGNEKDSVVLNLLRGSLRSVTGWISKTAPKNYRVNTPTATIGIRGTDHETAIVEEGSEAGVWNQVTEGTTTLGTQAGSLEQVAGQPSAAGRVGAGDQMPLPAPPPRSVFAPRPTDSRTLELKTDAQTNQQQRLDTRVQQVARAGGLSAQGNPRVSTQCTPDAPAQKALDALLRAYEQGNIGFIQQRIDPAMVGYGALVNDIMTDNNAQRQTRVQVLDRQMQCGPDVSVIDFAWEKYFLSSSNFAPIVVKGRGSVLISGLGNGLSGQWRVSGLVGDNPFRSNRDIETSGGVGAGTDGTVQASPAAASFGANPSGCVAAPPASVSGLAVAVLSGPAPTVSVSTVGPPTCSLSPPSTTFACSVSAAGVFGPTLGTAVPLFQFPSCSATGAFGTASGSLTYGLAGSTGFSGPAGSPITINVPVTLSATGTAPAASGSYALSSSASATCAVSVVLPTPPAPPPVCSPTPSTVNAAIEVRDADLTGPSVQVQVLASNGDNETLVLPRISAGVYRLPSIPIVRGAASVSPGNGRFELVGATPSSVTLTIRYTDAKAANGASVLRQTTLVLVP